MPSEEEEIINLIAQELTAGKSVDSVAGELVQAGLPQDEAYTVVNAVAQQMSRRGGPAPGGGGGGGGGGGINWGLWMMIIAIGVLAYIILRR